MWDGIAHMEENATWSVAIILLRTRQPFNNGMLPPNNFRWTRGVEKYVSDEKIGQPFGTVYDAAGHNAAAGRPQETYFMEDVGHRCDTNDGDNNVAR